MNIATLFVIAKALYSVIRPILKKAVDDPDEEWDDLLLGICDMVFGYKEGD